MRRMGRGMSTCSCVVGASAVGAASSTGGLDLCQLDSIRK
jgi:hypothetical protein